MNRIEKIENEIRSLDASELIAFRNWFLDFDAEAWDRQFESDAEAGKLESRAEQALSDHKSGRSTRL